MEFIKKAILEQPWQLFSAIGAIVLVVTPILWKQRKEIYTEQLYKVYLPLFKQVEPIIYSKVIQPNDYDFQEVMCTIESLLDKHYELFFSVTLLDYHRIKRNLWTKKQSTFIRDYIAFCINLDEKFEDLRKKLYFPRRGYLYKSFNRQFPNKLFHAFYFLRYTISFAFALFLVYCILILALIIFYFSLYWLGIKFFNQG